MSQSFPSPQEPAHQGCLGIRVQPKATSRLLLDSQDHSLPQKEHSCGTGFWFSWKDFKISKCYTGVFSGLMFWEKVLLLAGLAIPWVAVFKETKKKKNLNSKIIQAKIQIFAFQLTGTFLQPVPGTLKLPSQTIRKAVVLHGMWWQSTASGALTAPLRAEWMAVRT